MAAIINDDTQSIVVGSGDDRVAVNLKQASSVSDVQQVELIFLSNKKMIFLGAISIASSHINSNRNG